MVSGTRDNPPPEATLSSVCMWHCMIIHNPYWIIECSDFLFLWVSLGHSIIVGFAELIFTSLIRICASNPNFTHYVTLATPKVVPVWRAKAFIWRKVVPLPGLPYLPRRDSSPSEVVSPPETGSWSQCKIKTSRDRNPDSDFKAPVIWFRVPETALSQGNFIESFYVKTQSLLVESK